MIYSSVLLNPSSSVVVFEVVVVVVVGSGAGAGVAGLYSPMHFTTFSLFGAHIRAIT